MTVNKTNWKIAFAAMGALGGIAAILAYMDNKKANVLKKEVSLLEKEIRELELLKLRDEAKKSGLI